MNKPASPAGGVGVSEQPAAVMSPDAAARYLGCDRKSVYLALSRGEIPHLKLGRRLFIHRAVLDRLLGVTDDGPRL